MDLVEGNGFSELSVNRSPQELSQLHWLRRIGWSLWGPIGIDTLDGRPDDEYDTYLLHAASMFKRNLPKVKAVEYFVWAESVYMGMGKSPSIRIRAEATVLAICDYLDQE